MPSLVREDRDGPTSGVPVVAPAAVPGSYVGKGEPLKASKWEASPKMNPPWEQSPEGPCETSTLIGGRCTWCEPLSRAVLRARAA